MNIEMDTETSPIPEKFLGELEPQAHLLPPEFFKQQTNEGIRQITTLGNYIVAVFKDEKEGTDLYRAAVYSSEGRLQEVNLKEIGIDLARLVEERYFGYGSSQYMQYIWLTEQTSSSGSQSEPYNMKAFLAKLNYSDAEKRVIKSKILEIAKAKGLNPTIDKYFDKRDVVEFLAEANSRVNFNDIKLINIPGRDDLLLLQSGQQNTILQLTNGQISEASTSDLFPEGDLEPLLRQENLQATYESDKANVSIIWLDNKIATIRTGTEDLRSFKTESLVLDNREEPTIYFVSPDGKRIQSTDLERVKNGIWRPEDLDAELPADAQIEKLLLDPNGNFLSVEYQSEGQGKITLVDKETGRVWFTFEETSPVTTFDPAGNIIFIDQEGRLRKIQTNFSKIPAGGVEELSTARQRYLEEMAAKIASLSLPEVSAGARVVKPTSEGVLIKQLETRITNLVKEQVEKSQNVEELEALRQQLEVLKETNEYAEFPEAFAPAERLILQRENSFRVGALEKRAAEIQTNFGEIGSLEEAATLSKEAALLQVERAGVSILDPEQRQLIDGRIKTLQNLAQEAMNRHLGELDHRLEAGLSGLQASLTTALNEAEVAQIYADPAFVNLTSLLTYIQDPLGRQKWQQKITELIATQRREILGRQSQIFGASEHERASAQQITSEIFSELAAQVGQVKTARDVERFKSNPLIAQYLEQAQKMGSGLDNQAKTALENLLEERRSSLETERELEKLKSGEVIRFNGEEFPIFTPPPPDFEVKTTIVKRPGTSPDSPALIIREYLSAIHGRRLPHYGRGLPRYKPGPKRYEIEFVDKRGKVYKPEGYVREGDLDDRLKEETVRARHFFESQPRRVPKVPPDFVMTEHYRKIMAQVTRKLKVQLDTQEGMLILKGDAGIGKNVIIDVLASLTNREVFFVPCHAQMDKEDLTYTVEYDPKVGTRKNPSSLVEALTTPGAIIVFNEVNTAPVGVVKMTNPLLDYMRTFFLSLGGDKGSLKPDPSVILIGVMNPENYLGTKKLAQDFRSRASEMELDYPPPKDETIILSRKIESLKKMQVEEIEKLWDYVVDGKTGSGGDQFATPETQEDIRNLKQLVDIANKLREAYRSYMLGSDEVVEFVFTLRDSGRIATYYNLDKKSGHKRSMKEVVFDEILPKIGDLEEKERVRTIIENV